MQHQSPIRAVTKNQDLLEIPGASNLTNTIESDRQSHISLQAHDIEEFSSEALIEMILNFKETQKTIKKIYRQKREEYKQILAAKDAELGALRVEYDKVCQFNLDWEEAYNELKK